MHYLTIFIINTLKKINKQDEISILSKLFEKLNPGIIFMAILHVLISQEASRTASMAYF